MSRSWLVMCRVCDGMESKTSGAPVFFSQKKSERGVISSLKMIIFSSYEILIRWKEETVCRSDWMNGDLNGAIQFNCWKWYPLSSPFHHEIIILWFYSHMISVFTIEMTFLKVLKSWREEKGEWESRCVIRLTQTRRSRELLSTVLWKWWWGVKSSFPSLFWYTNNNNECEWMGWWWGWCHKVSHSV